MADCQPAYSLCSFLFLSYFFPNFSFSSFLVLVLPSFPLSVSFLSCLVFPSLSLSFFLSCVGIPVPCVPGVPASSRTFLFHIYFFTRMYSYVTRMPLVCDSYVTRMYSYVFVCHRCVPVCARMLLVCSRMLLVCILGTVNSRLLHGNLMLCSTRDNRKSQRKTLGRSMTSLQYLLNFEPTLDNLKSFQWTLNSRIL